MSSMDTVIAWSASILACLVVHTLWKRRVSRGSSPAAKLPPGPRRLPLLGNIFDIPRTSPWKTFTAWSKKYGDVVYLEVLGRPIILLNTVEATTDLLEERFSIYSDRPRFPLMDLVGHTWNFGMYAYGPHWRAQRRGFAEGYSIPKSLQSFYPAQRRSVHKFLTNVLRDPDGFSNHLKLKSGQLIMDVTYGIDVDSADHPLIHTTERVMDVTSIALSPPMWLANPWALVDYLPKWLGGSSITRTLQRWRDDLEELRNTPFNMAKKDFMNGSARPSYTANRLQAESPAEGSEEELTIRDTAAIAFGAALETTIITGEVFLLAVVLNPHVATIAQKEIDEVIGTHRLPDYSDRDHLPYVSALVKEVLRFHPPAPTGIPHYLREDDVYKGMFMPKGSVVMGNVWGITHNPELYPDPMAFKPERYIRDGLFDCSTNDPSRYVFGFGRRVCPGRLFSEDVLWLTIAQFLAVYDVSLPEGSEPPRVEFVSGAISKPLPFKCNIMPRSEAARQLIDCGIRE